MKKLCLAFLFLVAATANAQSIALTTPVTMTALPFAIVREFHVDDTTQTAWVRIRYTQNADGSGALTDPPVIYIPADQNNPGTEYDDFLGAIGTAAPGETGLKRRRANYRIMRYLTTTYARVGGSAIP